MSLAKYLLHCILFLILSIGLEAYADDQQEVKQVIQSLYKEDAKTLQCHNSDGNQNKKLIVVVEQYFTNDFMKVYKPVCVDLASDWVGDIRTGEPDTFPYPDSKAGFTNLKIGQPKITGNQATIRTTYDFPDATYQEYGNFTVFTMIKENGQWKIDDIELGGYDMDKYNERESMTGLKTYKSVKQYIKKSLMETAAKQHKSLKKSP
jgi:hypothetical protein